MSHFDVNCLIAFASIVRYGGIGAASRWTGVPKSRLSRNLRCLEDQLGARLVERTNRSFKITTFGQAYVIHCQNVLQEIAAAEALTQSYTGEPHGSLRVAAPPGPLARAVAAMLPALLAEHPALRIELVLETRPVDIVQAEIDVSVRVATGLDADHDLIVRKLGLIDDKLVASPLTIERYGRPGEPCDLSDWAIVGIGGMRNAADTFNFTSDDGRTLAVPIHPLASTDDPDVGRILALSGMGAALLPEDIVRDDIAEGRLIELLPDFRRASRIVHLVFPSRRCMLPSSRVLIDRLSSELGSRRRSPSKTAIEHAPCARAA